MPDINVMENIHKDIEACGRCDCKKLQVNSKMVMNGGNLNAALFFVGIAPSFYNHTEFVFEVENYPTNRIFHEGLKRIGLTRYDVYITNAVKCSTDKNVSPVLTNYENCEHFLKHEIEAIKPELIIFMGRDLSIRYSAKINSITKCFGISATSIYHPSYYARRPELIDRFFANFDFIKASLDKIKAQRTLV